MSAHVEPDCGRVVGDKSCRGQRPESRLLEPEDETGGTQHLDDLKGGTKPLGHSQMVEVFNGESVRDEFVSGCVSELDESQAQRQMLQSYAHRHARYR